ncbi:MAG TPA: adenine deaminase [Gaiellaceae bacterium]|nr:adenine deaminase [Gaiellaceae bacterium]
MSQRNRITDLARRLAVARGDEPADLVIRGGRVFSAFTREWLDADVAVVDGVVAGLGEYDGRETLDASGRWLVSGFVDAHLHIESSKLMVDEFARLVLPLGTTAIVADPHEIANVLGTDGVHWLLDASSDLPLDVYFMAPSCVPASDFESPRRALTIGDLEGLLRRSHVLGVAEMMNFPGVVGGSEHELAKIRLARHVDGHAPGLVGRKLNAYASVGIQSDHEAATLEEGRERLRAGMWLLIREASAARNLAALVPLALEYGPSRIAFCTDDREPEHIADDGHINSIVRDAVALGVPAEDALVMASLNGAQYHGLDGIGAIAPGYRADVLVLPDLVSFVPELVLKAGKPVEEIPSVSAPEWVRNTVRVGSPAQDPFRIPWTGGKARVIGLVPGQIVTESLADEPTVEDGYAVADPARDLAKIAVLERHLGTGRIGLGFVRGFGLERGAFGATLAHDAHNMVVVGADDGSMSRVAARLSELGGGIVVADGDELLSELPLPVAGLLSDRPLADVLEASRALNAAARRLGVAYPHPFQVLAFLALSVIPSLKITDRGLVDVDRFELVPLAL